MNIEQYIKLLTLPFFADVERRMVFIGWVRKTSVTETREQLGLSVDRYRKILDGIKKFVADVKEKGIDKVSGKIAKTETRRSKLKVWKDEYMDVMVQREPTIIKTKLSRKIYRHHKPGYEKYVHLQCVNKVNVYKLFDTLAEAEAYRDLVDSEITYRGGRYTFRRRVDGVMKRFYFDTIEDAERNRDGGI